MKVLVTGASGLVGRHVMDALRGHEVVVASRDPTRHEWPAHVDAVAWPSENHDASGLPDVDAVIHLAGASIGGRRWSRAYQEEIRRSRVESTRDLVARYGQGTKLVCVSAVGYYGRDPAGPCPEERGAGDDFLAQVCRDWETAAREHAGPVAVMRLGHVLAAGDGILGRLEPLHKARLAGVVPPGTQELPWIHVDDLARRLAWAATSDWTGTHNAVAGNVAYRDLHKALCDRIGGLKWLTIPAVALRLRLGAFAPYLMGGQHVVTAPVAGMPDTQFEDLGDALDDLYPPPA